METALKDRIPPHSIEAEQAVLGALLQDWSAMGEVVSKLRPDRFYSIQNQIIYDALVKLNTKSVRGDTLSLINQLTEDGTLEKAGGPAYIASLTNTVASAANINYYADIVLDRSTRRELIKISSELRAESFELNQDSKTLLDLAEKKIFAPPPWKPGLYGPDFPSGKAGPVWNL